MYFVVTLALKILIYAKVNCGFSGFASLKLHLFIQPHSKGYIIIIEKGIYQYIRDSYTDIKTYYKILRLNIFFLYIFAAE